MELAIRFQILAAGYMDLLITTWMDTEKYKDEGEYSWTLSICYYYRNYSFYKDIQMILCTVFGKKMKYAGEII